MKESSNSHLLVLKSKHLEALGHSAQQLSPKQPFPAFEFAFELYHYVRNEAEEVEQEEQKLLEAAKMSILKEYNQRLFQEEINRLKIQSFILESTLQIQNNQQEILKEQIEILTYQTISKPSLPLPIAPQDMVKQKISKQKTLSADWLKQKRASKICPLEVIVWQPGILEISNRQLTNGEEEIRLERVQEQAGKSKKKMNSYGQKRRHELLEEVVLRIQLQEQILQQSSNQKGKTKSKGEILKEIKVFWAMTNRQKEKEGAG